MARVIVIGSGIAGLSAAIHASAAGHHVVILEKASRIGGRGTSQNKDTFSLHYGPHLLDKKGPFYKLCRTLSRVRISTAPLRLDKIEIVGAGLLRPTGNISKVIETKKALKAKNPKNPIFKSSEYISSWGLGFNKPRWNSFLKSKLCVSNEGWIGLIGRLAAALDEIGVLIETKSEVKSIKDKKIELKNGRMVECDAIILACGFNGAKKLLNNIDSKLSGEVFSRGTRITASVIEAGITSKPMAGKQCIIDQPSGMAIIDYVGIQPRLNITGSHISAIAVGGLKSDNGDTIFQSPDERADKLESFLDSQISGWKDHIVTDMRQETITLGHSKAVDGMAFKHHGVLLAGAWVQSEYILADAAAQTGIIAGQSLKTLANVKTLE